MAARASTPLIVHIIHGLRAGGLENGLVNLINRMPNERYRHAVICLTGYDRFAERIERDVPLFALEKREGKDPGLYLRVWRLLRRLRPDIVHTRNFGALEMQVPACLARVPARIHGEHGRDMNDLHGMHPRYLRMRRLLRPLVHRYVALSREFVDYLVDTVGAPAERVLHICNGVDTERFQPDTDDRIRRRAALGWDSQATVIGWVGRMEPVKDPLVLARAFVELARRDPAEESRPVLAMVGNGSQCKQLRHVIEAAGLAERAWLPGRRDDIAGVLRAMDLFVLTSRAEGISNTILEAMACGLPVVATRVGGNPELVAEHSTGRLVEPADPVALADLLEDYIAHPDRLAEQGRAARARAVDSFDIDTMVTAYTGLYDKVLAAGRNSRAVRGAHSEAG